MAFFTLEIHHSIRFIKNDFISQSLDMDSNNSIQWDNSLFIESVTSWQTPPNKFIRCSSNIPRIFYGNKSRGQRHVLLHRPIFVQFFQTSFYYYFLKKSLIRWFQNFQFKAIDLMRLSFWCFSLFFFCVCDLIYLGDFIVDLLFWACFCFGFKSNRVLLWFIWICWRWVWLCFVFGFGHWIVTVGR